MKKLIKLTLLLLISLTVNSKNTCLISCPKTAEASKMAEISAGVDENDWILNTRFKY